MKVIIAFLKYDYGKNSRGGSLEKNVFFPAMKKAVDEVIPFWLEENGYPDDINGLQNKLMKFVRAKKPDLVFFILMRDEIRVSTIQEINKVSRTANWFCDDQWRFDSFSRIVGPVLTYVITVDKFSVYKYKLLRCENVILSQWATTKYLKQIDFDSLKYKYDVSFVGGWNLTREWFVRELERKGVFVKCFGYGWDKGRLTTEQMNEVFLKSRINLNLSNSIPMDIRYYSFLKKQLFSLLFKKMSFKKKMRNYILILKTLLGVVGKKKVEQIKARNFEIPGGGGFELSQYAPEIEDYYIIGKEIAVFTNIDDLYLQIKFYLSNPEIRMQVTKNGYIKTAEYTYEERMRRIFKEIDK